jgi:hypothetical protein
MAEFWILVNFLFQLLILCLYKTSIYSFPTGAAWLMGVCELSFNRNDAESSKTWTQILREDQKSAYHDHTNDECLTDESWCSVVRK